MTDISANIYECPVCYDKNKANGFVTPTCGHIICLKCYTKIVRMNKECGCPCCRTKYPVEQTAAISTNIDMTSLDLISESSILSQQQIEISRGQIVLELDLGSVATNVLPEYIHTDFYSLLNEYFVDPENTQ